VSWEQAGPGYGDQCFAVRVRTDPEGTITEAAPLVRKFVGQKLKHLTAWVGYKQVRVDLVSSAKEKRDERYDRRQTG
jgi:hypothetical protein